MAAHAQYYPARVGDQLIWLGNFRNKIGNYQALLDYAAGDITDVRADCDRVSWLLDTLQDAAQSFAKAVTGHIKLMQDGPPGSELVPPPTFALPTTPAPPANVLPGALKRVFAFIANLKTRAGYDDSIGQDLGIIGTEITPNPDAVPDGKATAKSGEVLIRVKKERHTGVFISGQVATETTWTDVGIATTATYHDTRPLKVAGQPEKRRYRFCFWDGTPTNVWSPVIEVVYGG